MGNTQSSDGHRECARECDEDRLVDLLSCDCMLSRYSSEGTGRKLLKMQALPDRPWVVESLDGHKADDDISACIQHDFCIGELALVAGLGVAVDSSCKPWLSLSARVVDFWEGSTKISGEFASWLRSVGFDVHHDVSERQIGQSCGIVAAEVVALAYAAHVRQRGSWYDTSFSGAVSHTRVEQANVSQDKWARDKFKFTNAELALDACATRLTVAGEIKCLARQRMRELQIPACPTCGSALCANLCPSLSLASYVPGSPQRLGSQRCLKILHLKDCYAEIRSELLRASQRGEGCGLRCIVANTAAAVDVGRDPLAEPKHWFTVLYSIDHRVWPDGKS